MKDEQVRAAIIKNLKVVRRKLKALEIVAVSRYINPIEDAIYYLQNLKKPLPRSSNQSKQKTKRKHETKK